MRTYGAAPMQVLPFMDLDLREVMYYLYLPVRMPGTELRVPRNIACLDDLILAALSFAKLNLRRNVSEDYVYVSARKGWATPDNPLNRPGWHADGFGTDDLNFVWWKGPGTRFLVGNIKDVPEDHVKSMQHFEEWAKAANPTSENWPEHGALLKANYPESHLYCIDPFVVHATPLIETPCWRQYVKISLSTHKYNLENNSHNYLFSYDWQLHGRDEVRNDTSKAQRDYA